MSETQSSTTQENNGPALHSLDDLLDHGRDLPDLPDGAGQPPEADQQESDARTGEHAPEQQDGPTRDERGRFVAKPGDAAPPAAENASGGVPLPALKDERSKRQAAETEAASLRGELDALRREIAAIRQPPEAAKPPDPPKPAPSPVEDPEGFAAYQAEQQWNMQLNMSETILRQDPQKSDVDQMRDVFLDAAKADPTLFTRLRQQVHPWGWMYAEAKRLLHLKEIGNDPGAYRDRLRAEILKEIQGQGGNPPAAAPAAPPSATPPLPTSLAAERNVVGRTASTQSAGIEPMEELVRFKG